MYGFTMTYTKFTIPNLKEIQEEVLNYFKNNPELLKPESKEEYFVQVDTNNTPILKEYLTKHSRSKIVETSTCFLPGHTNLHTHIDGLKKDCDLVPEGKLKANRHVLIIPIENTEETINYWFRNEDVSDSEERIVRRIRPVPPYDFYVSFCDKELEPIAQTTIDRPTFIKSDIYHTVHNLGPKTRLVFIVRFYEQEEYTINDLFDILT